MNTEERPETTMVMSMVVRCSGGKLRLMLAEDQFSKSRVQRRRIGMERRLL